ncbi:hypothetical protein [Phenylobacterium sp.]|uniref:hypothetical protein n=1 Tax=Phenylobacterium sp. TaxID=1871053 RepID=UPI002C45EE9E|nr:hypothetical protein [Phenylobacterium sp.]HLZ73889.1 hypothetical protein [Phenylobacterium sp.]
MRFAIWIAALTAGGTLAGAVPDTASAQMMGQMGQMGSMGQGMMMGTQPAASSAYGAGADGARFPTTQERYAAKILALRQKMQKLTQQDGGRLSDEHKASLQRELDGVNKSFGIKPAAG